MCIDDNNKCKLFGMNSYDHYGSIQLEVTACDPSKREDPSTCETEDAKVLEYLDDARRHLRVDILTNFKTYDTQNY